MDRKMLEIALRYALLLVMSFFALDALYWVFTPLTAYPTYYILSLFYESLRLVSTSAIILNEDAILLVPACIAGAAYFLLLILNLSVPVSLKRRLHSLLFLFASFYALNLLRIVIFSFLFLNHSPIFDVTHRAVWYVGSTFLVAFIWFANVRIFKISGIPVVSDVRTILRAS